MATLQIAEDVRIRKRIGNNIAWSIKIVNASGEGEDFTGKNPKFCLISPRKTTIVLNPAFETDENGKHTGRVFFMWLASEQKYIGEYQFVFTEDGGVSIDKKAFITLYASLDDFEESDGVDELQMIITQETAASKDARDAAEYAKSVALELSEYIDGSIGFDMDAGKFYIIKQ